MSIVSILPLLLCGPVIIDGEELGSREARAELLARLAIRIHQDGANCISVFAKASSVPGTLLAHLFTTLKINC